MADNLALFAPSASEQLSEGAVLLRGFAAALEVQLVYGIGAIASIAPFRHMHTPGGYRMSVAMTNCGPLGWVTDDKGYRYEATDPGTGKPWPEMPPSFHDLAQHAAAEAGFPAFDSDACLINRYQPGARMTLHQDKDEADYSVPIVSVSLGLPATFLFGGMKRKDPVRRVKLESGDVVVWGGPARLAYHGVATLARGEYGLTENFRYNLTFRRAT